MLGPLKAHKKIKFTNKSALKIEKGRQSDLVYLFTRKNPWRNEQNVSVMTDYENFSQILGHL